MGKGSTTTSGRPTFRTGNIRTPADPRVTERTSVPRTFVAADPLIGCTSHDINGIKIAGRESIATERANAPERVAPVYTDKGTSGLWLRHAGTSFRGVERLHAYGDDALPSYTVPVPVVEEKTARTPKRSTDVVSDAEREAARAAKDAENRAILAYVRSLGYKGTLTADIRSLALDSLAFAGQVEAYKADITRTA